ncbi:MAG: RagB/SusD family nutrient uptake outer membrane protein, partial [Chitinophagaceae bacterium]|nr:RagB/SusD family nutrient uptake outer membrane protein [Chitinophagaceae bacterium]
SIPVCIFILMINLCSCKKYLDVRPNLAIVSPTTLENAQALLDYSQKMNLSITPSCMEASADDYFLTPDSYNALLTSYQDIYIWQQYIVNYPNDWSACYLPVYTANYCLEVTEKQKRTPQNEATWGNVHGSALFFRSYYFLELLMQYAKAYKDSSAKIDLGIPLRTSSDFNVPSERSSVYDCYHFILNDLKTATALLPDLPAHVLRPSKCATYGLLARTYLLMNQFDSALKYSNRALSQNSSLIDYNMSPCDNCDIRAPLASTAAIFKKFNAETLFYTEMNGYGTTQGASRALVDTILYKSYMDNDLRKIAFFTPKGGFYRFKGTYSQSTLSNYFTGITTAEMYLISAECSARLNDVDNSMKLLNTLLSKRMKVGTFQAVSAADQQEAIAIVTAERRKELFFRGLRWADIKRYNALGAGIILTRKIGDNIYTLMPDAGYYALPIPDDVIKQGGIKQNPK